MDQLDPVDSVDCEEDVAVPDHRGPNPIKLFVCGFAIVLVLGGAGAAVWSSVGDWVDGIGESLDSVKQTAGDIAEIRNQHWFEEHAIYLKADENGLSLASNDDVEAHQQWEEAMEEAMKRNHEFMEGW